MMDEEKIDHELRNRISQVFENYDDTTADEGWAMLRQKYPPQSKDPGLAWLWYAAAAVVLLCLTIWFIPKSVPDQIAAVKTKKTASPQNIESKPPAVTDTALQTGSNSIAKVKMPANATILADTGQTTANHAAMAKVESFSHQPASKTFNVPLPRNTSNVSQTVNVNPQVAVVNPQIMVMPKAIADTIARQRLIANMPVNKQKTAPESRPVDNAVVTSAQIANHVPAQAPKANPESAAINKLLAEKPVAKTNDGKKTDKAARNGMFSVYAATFVSYAQGSDNQFNVGAGFTSDFKLSKRLKLSTGLAIAQNTLSYNNQNTPSLNMASSDRIFGSPAPASAFSDAFVTSNTALSITATAAPAIKKYNAALIGLDIPINLKYEFNPEKSDLFVSAGLSSGTFINETYRSTYTYRQSSQESTTSSSFSRFDLAKTLNFSFGIGYPLGKSNRLIVEPFLKYPLDGVGSEQIRFGSGGINLKLNFQSGKK